MSFSATDVKKIKKAVGVLDNRATQTVFFDTNTWTFTIKDFEGNELTHYSCDDAPTICRFHDDKNDIHKLTMGPRGSSKSTGCGVAELMFINYLNPPCKDGVKRSRFLIGRQTYGELQTTTIKTFEMWLKHDCLNWRINKQPPIDASIAFFDGEAWNEVEFIFVSFDNEKAAKKALSLELTAAFFNEASKIAMAPMDETVGSIARYPAKKDKSANDEAYYHPILYDTNAFEDYHPFYNRFVKNKIEGHAFFLQPGGMIEASPGVFEENPNAENTKNLPTGYYHNMSLGKPLSFIRTQICNQFGTHEDGKPVHPEYSVDKHSTENIGLDSNHPIWLLHDYGGTNATVICQYVQGQLRAIKELQGFKEGLTAFQKNVVAVWLRDNAKDFEVERSVGDPADNYSHETARKSSELVSEALEIQTYSAKTNNIKARIGAVDTLLVSRRGDGGGAILISRTGCPVLHAGMAGKYQLELRKQNGIERVIEVPIKNEYSHVCDCLQYGALEVQHIRKFKDDEEDEPIDTGWGSIV